MLKKILLLSFVGTSAITSANSSEPLKSQNVFIDLMKCMNSSSLTKKSYNGIGYQQIVLNSVLENVTQQNVPSIAGVETDYSKVYQLVVKHCPKELGEIKNSLDTKAR